MDRVLSQAAYLRRSFPLFFIPLVPYPARSARHLPHAGKGDRAAVDRVLSLTAHLRRSLPALFHTARTLSGSLRSPPSPRGEGFVRRYSFSTYACICSDDARKAVFSFRSLPHWGRGTASAVDRALSQTAHLRRSFPLFFIPLEPYPARFARHLPHAGKALSIVILFLHIYPVFALTIWG